ncbi:hypothetical protein TNCV_755151 [Trichonephila clavipes]|nr:hypothetical protein TNCV_755151 [Trichonephila clavipes]
MDSRLEWKAAHPLYVFYAGKTKQNKNNSPKPYIKRKIACCVPVARWIARWTSNPKVMGDSTICLVSTPILREDTWGWPGTTHLSIPSNNHTRGLAARRLFRVPPCRKGTIHLQSSMSSPGFEPNPYGTAVSDTDHYTGWATYRKFNSQPISNQLQKEDRDSLLCRLDKVFKSNGIVKWVAVGERD